MRTKVKAFIAVIVVLMVVTAISIIIISRGPLYGKAGDDNWVPDMKGWWAMSESATYYFLDVFDTETPPEYIEFTAGPPDSEGYFRITHQTGRVFAGIWYDGLKKLTGVILPDRTVSIQVFEPSEYKGFLTGRLTKSGSTLQISSGYGHHFSDFGLPANGDKSMSSGYGRIVKID